MRWRPLLLVLVAAVSAAAGFAAEVIPAAPRDHFNDYAGIVRREVAAQLENELTQFERDSTNQILVVIYPHMQSDSSIEDYTVRVAQSWQVGQKDRRNGAVLFIFSQDRKLFIQVGYGLEAVLPDARCKQIVEDEIKPHFRSGDYSAGVAAGVHAIIASVRGEYQGTGRTTAEAKGGKSPFNPAYIFFAVVVLIMVSRFRRQRTFGYGRNGRFFPVFTGGGGGGGGFTWGGGGGGGSFSGGGGSFGGGGAGGSW